MASAELSLASARRLRAPVREEQLGLVPARRLAPAQVGRPEPVRAARLLPARAARLLPARAARLLPALAARLRPALGERRVRAEQLARGQP
jgi:hypothetical protein